eukprot:16380_6
MTCLEQVLPCTAPASWLRWQKRRLLSAVLSRWANMAESESRRIIQPKCSSSLWMKLRPRTCRRRPIPDAFQIKAPSTGPIQGPMSIDRSYSDKSAYVSIRPHTSAYVSIRQHTIDRS